jgi:transposase
MNSLTDLREVVDVVIGVDTHVHTHSAAVVDTATGGVLDEITVEATAEGYVELVGFANNHAMLRAWAIEGTGGHGAGLSRQLLEMSELVIEVDRPKRAARRNGAKSDPLDAISAAREAMARPRLGTPRSGGERLALSVLLAARRSAINASTEAQQQVFSLVIAAPEPIRARFRGQKLAAMLNTERSSKTPRPGLTSSPAAARSSGGWSATTPAAATPGAATYPPPPTRPTGPLRCPPLPNHPPCGTVDLTVFPAPTR